MLRSNDSRFIVALGDIYAKLEKWDEAKRCYIKAYSVGDYEGVSLCKLAKYKLIIKINPNKDELKIKQTKVQTNRTTVKCHFWDLLLQKNNSYQFFDIK